MNRLFKNLFSAPFQAVLVVSFSLVAALTIAIGTWTISRTITDYLSNAMNERVARDMQLAQALYNLTLDEIEGITQRIVMDPLVIYYLSGSHQRDENTQAIIEQQITTNISGLAFGGNQLIAILDQNGELIAGRLRSGDGQQTALTPSSNWTDLEIIQQVLSSGKPITATEVIPAELLTQVGLADQARISILDTPKAAIELFDAREGTAALALVSVFPIKDETDKTIGVVMASHLFNNDFTLVDRIKEVAGIDTATIFLGDLRVSTNVMTQEGERAIGTRVSEEVSQVVLNQGNEYVGTAFVVNENYITRYDPLKDHAGQEIGILYVGAKQASFYRLVNVFNQRIILVAIGTIILTIILTTPVSRAITRPLNQLKDLVEANRRVAGGDMSVRVPVRASGQIGLLGSSFNTMLDTLQTTQDQLVQSEKLASLGQLAAGVAHELNNPLGTILLYSDILLKEIDPESPHKTDLEIIVNETKRCKGIVGSLLEFARQNQVNAQPMDLNALIKSVIEVERKRYEGSAVEMIPQLDPNLPKIQADPDQMMQVLVNLIDNAVEEMPQGGKLFLRTFNEPEAMVTFEVEDTGRGIPQDNLSKLFTPFFTTKPIGKGTGLGLPIIYGIIKMHRGQINVHSEVDKGTKFRIQLPIRHQGINNSNQRT